MAGFDIIQQRIEFTGSGDNTVIASQPNKRIKIYNIIVSFLGDVDVIIKSGATMIAGPMTIFAGGTINTKIADNSWTRSMGYDEALIFNLSRAVRGAGSVTFSYAD